MLPIDERSLVELIRLRTPLGLYNRSELILRPGQSAVPFATRVTGSDRSMRAQVQLSGRLSDHLGVLLASGSAIGGYTLFIQGNRLHFEHLCLGQRVVCAAAVDAPQGDVEVGFRLTRGQEREARVELLHGEEVVADAAIAHTSGHLSFFGLSVCSDAVSQVSPLYQGSFDYPKDGVKAIRITFLDAASANLSATILQTTE